jgi:hypothetical protein
VEAPVVVDSTAGVIDSAGNEWSTNYLGIFLRSYRCWWIWRASNRYIANSYGQYARVRTQKKSLLTEHCKDHVFRKVWSYSGKLFWARHMSYHFGHLGRRIECIAM